MTALLPLESTVLMKLNAGGTASLTVSVAVLVTVPSVAEMTAEVVPWTGSEDTVKLALDAPPGTTTPAGGTVAANGLLLDRLIVRPPVGAGPSSVTVPVDLVGYFTVVGLSVSEISVDGTTVSN